MSRIQILQIHATYLRELERQFAVAVGIRRDKLATKIRAAKSKLRIINHESTGRYENQKLSDSKK